MRVTLLTLLMMAAMDADMATMLLFVALLPLLLAATFLLLLLPWRSPVVPHAWQERERHLDPRPVRWRPAHRVGSPRLPRGRHEPGRGRFAAVARQAQLEEHTVAVDARAFLREGP